MTSRIHSLVLTKTIEKPKMTSRINKLREHKLSLKQTKDEIVPTVEKNQVRTMKKVKTVMEFMQEDKRYNEIRMCELINEKMNEYDNTNDFKIWVTKYLDNQIDCDMFDPHVFMYELCNGPYELYDFSDWCLEYLKSSHIMDDKDEDEDDYSDEE